MIGNCDAAFLRHRLRHGDDTGLDEIELRQGHDQRHHDLGGHGLAGLAAGLHRALENGARLHFRDFGITDGDAHAAEAQHGVELVQLGGAALQLLRARAHGLGDFRDFRIRMGQEFVQRGIEQADGHRQARHDLEQVSEILPLHGQQLGERMATTRLVIREDHLAHGHDAVALEEHMLGAAQADAIGAEVAGHPRVGGGVRIGAHLHAAHQIGPFHDLGEIAREFRLQHGRGAFQHLTRRAVDGDDVALLHHLARDREGLRGIVDADGASARDAGLAHAARNHRRMGGHAAARGQNALGGVHAVDILGRGLHAHQNDLAARVLQQLGFIGIEDDLAAGRARRRGQARADHLAVGLGVDGGMQQLIEGGRINAQDRLFVADEALARHVHRDAQGRLGGALAAARLEHPELAALDREFHVLHVAVVLFQQMRHADEFGEALGQRRLHGGLVGMGGDARHFRDVLGGADARHHILALGVDEELAVKLVLAGGGVAREGDAGGGGLAHVAEDHGLHIHRRAPTLGDVVKAAIGDGALVHPGAEDSAHRAPELGARILREGLAGLLRDAGLVARDDLAPVGGVEVGVEHMAVHVLVLFEDLLEIVVAEVKHHIGIHLDEAAIAIPGETLVACGFGHGDHGLVVEAKVQHRVHHAGHGGAGAGPHGDQQRIGLIAEHMARDAPDIG